MKGHAGRVVDGVNTNMFHRHYFRELGEFRDLLRGPAHLDAVNGVLQFRQYLHAVRLYERRQCVLLLTASARDRLLGGCR